MPKPKQVTDKSLANTGERLIPAYNQAELVYGEHVVRYEASQELVRGKVILDIASGSGYGSAILGKAAKHVTGVDNDKKAIEYAIKNYGSKKVTFRHGDGTKIPLGDNSIDVVVSFETIEHIKNYQEFMRQVKRVLKPGGIFILSTPNDLEYPEGNHFHIHEFTPKELQQLVNQYFAYSKSYYQGNWLYNALFEEETLSRPDTRLIKTMQLAPTPIEKCVYLFLVCSGKPIKDDLEPLAAMSEHWSERAKVDKEMAIEKERSEHIRTIRRLEKTIDEKHEELLKALQEREHYRHALEAIQKTKVWRALKKSSKVKKHFANKRKQ